MNVRSPVSTSAVSLASPRPTRRLDRKLSNIAAGRYTPDEFVLADAKDADMGFGAISAGPVVGAPSGIVGPGRYGTRQAYLAAMRAQIAQGEPASVTSSSNEPSAARRSRHPPDLSLQRRTGRSRRYVCRVALAPVPHGRARRDPAVLRPGALFDDVQQRPGA